MGKGRAGEWEVLRELKLWVGVLKLESGEGY